MNYPKELVIFPRGDDPTKFHGVIATDAIKTLPNGYLVAVYKLDDIKKITAVVSFEPAEED